MSPEIEQESLDELEAHDLKKPAPTVMAVRGSNRRKNRRAQKALEKRAKRQAERQMARERK